MTAENKLVPRDRWFRYLSGNSEPFSFVWHKASMKLWGLVVLEQPFWSCQCGEMGRGQGKRLKKQKKQTAANSVVDSAQQMLGAGSRKDLRSSLCSRCTGKSRTSRSKWTTSGGGFSFLSLFFFKWVVSNYILSLFRFSFSGNETQCPFAEVCAVENLAKQTEGNS